MTEDEAKTKWCPMVRGSEETSGGNVGLGDTRYGMCIGSGCMMWRYEYSLLRKGCGTDKVYMKHGYCGLAGKP